MPLGTTLFSVGTPSPSWHRRLRTKRSKARTRSRWAKQQGFAPAAKDSARLFFHHAGGAGEGMGKNWNKNKSSQSWGKKDTYDERAYRYWSGSWSVSLRHTASPSARYDKVKIPEPNTTSKVDALHPWRATDKEASGQMALMNAIQRSLTSARKADGRMRRLQDEKQRRQQQWDQWVKEQKINYHKQRKQFEADITKIDQDLAQTAEAGSTAAANVKNIILQGVDNLSQQRDQQEPDDGDWDRMMQEDMIVETAGFYKEAVQAARTLQPQPLSTTTGPVPSAPAPAATYSQSSPGPTATDPYLTSPRVGAGSAHREALGKATRGTNIGPPQGPDAEAATPPTTPIRGTPGPARTPAPHIRPVALPQASEPPGDLADRLSANRESRRKAMQPFGVRPRGRSATRTRVEMETTENAPVEAARPPGPGDAVTPAPSLIDDDVDELDKGCPSPGFGSLE